MLTSIHFYSRSLSYPLFVSPVTFPVMQSCFYLFFQSLVPPIIRPLVCFASHSLHSFLQSFLPLLIPSVMPSFHHPSCRQEICLIPGPLKRLQAEESVLIFPSEAPRISGILHSSLLLLLLGSRVRRFRETHFQSRVIEVLPNLFSYESEIWIGLSNTGSGKRVAWMNFR